MQFLPHMDYRNLAHQNTLRQRSMVEESKAYTVPLISKVSFSSFFVQGQSYERKILKYFTITVLIYFVKITSGNAFAKTKMMSFLPSLQWQQSNRANYHGWLATFMGGILLTVQKHSCPYSSRKFSAYNDFKSTHSYNTYKI